MMKVKHKAFRRGQNALELGEHAGIASTRRLSTVRILFLALGIGLLRGVAEAEQVSGVSEAANLRI